MENIEEARALVKYWHDLYEKQELLTKRILVDLQKKGAYDSMCEVCKMYGQDQVKCPCMQDDECARHCVKLAELYYREENRIEQPGKENEEKN